MRCVLLQGPEGSPNFCFGLYRTLASARKEAKAYGLKGYSRMTERQLEKEGFDTCVHFIQSDWECAGLASSLGWVPCKCGRTDGTVSCEHRTVSQMLSEAFDYLAKRDGKMVNFND